MSYKITNIDIDTGNVTVNFDYDNLEQVIDCSGSLDTPDNLKAKLTDYEQAYVIGKDLEATQALVVPKDVQALVGETITTEV